MRSIIGAITLTLTWAAYVFAQTSLIDLASIDPQVRAKICSSNIDICGTLCDGDASNSCEPTTLTYTCICNSNDTAPGLQYYKNTVPSLLCEETYKNCIIQAVTAAGQAKCLDTHNTNCGTLDIANYTSPAQTTSSLVTSTSSSKSSSSSITSTTSSSTSSSASSSVSSPTSSSSTTSTSPSLASDTAISKGGGGGLTSSAKIAVGVTIPLVFVIAVLALLWFLRRRRNTKEDESIHEAELHGDSRVHEFPGHKIPSIHEVGASENEKDIGYVAPFVAEISTEEDVNSNVITTSRGNIQELPDEGFSATMSGPLSYEMPTAAFGRTEMSASPVLGSGQLVRTDTDTLAREHSDDSALPPRSPIRRRELPATPLLAPIPMETSQPPPIPSPQDDAEDIENERQALEQRRAKITAERERLKRMQELDEEESGIEQRLSTLGRPQPQ